MEGDKVPLNSPSDTAAGKGRKTRGRRKSNQQNRQKVARQQQNNGRTYYDINWPPLTSASVVISKTEEIISWPSIRSSQAGPVHVTQEMPSCRLPSPSPTTPSLLSMSLPQQQIEHPRRLLYYNDQLPTSVLLSQRPLTQPPFKITSACHRPTLHNLPITIQQNQSEVVMGPTILGDIALQLYHSPQNKYTGLYEALPTSQPYSIFSNAQPPLSSPISRRFSPLNKDGSSSDSDDIQPSPDFKNRCITRPPRRVPTSTAPVNTTNNLTWSTANSQWPNTSPQTSMMPPCTTSFNIPSPTRHLNEQSRFLPFFNLQQPTQPFGNQQPSFNNQLSNIHLAIQHVDGISAGQRAQPPFGQQLTTTHHSSSSLLVDSNQRTYQQILETINRPSSSDQSVGLYQQRQPDTYSCYESLQTSQRPEMLRPSYMPSIQQPPGFRSVLHNDVRPSLPGPQMSYYPISYGDARCHFVARRMIPINSGSSSVYPNINHEPIQVKPFCTPGASNTSAACGLNHTLDQNHNCQQCFQNKKDHIEASKNKDSAAPIIVNKEPINKEAPKLEASGNNPVSVHQITNNIVTTSRNSQINVPDDEIPEVSALVEIQVPIMRVKSVPWNPPDSVSVTSDDSLSSEIVKDDDLETNIEEYPPRPVAPHPWATDPDLESLQRTSQVRNKFTRKIQSKARTKCAQSCRLHNSLPKAAFIRPISPERDQSQILPPAQYRNVSYLRRPIPIKPNGTLNNTSHQLDIVKPTHSAQSSGTWLSLLGSGAFYIPRPSDRNERPYYNYYPSDSSGITGARSPGF